jgi:hypothetical protein
VAPSSSGGGSVIGGGGGALMDSVRRAASAAVSSTGGSSMGGLLSSTMMTGASGKVQQWNGVVTIVLIDGTDLIACDDDGFSDPYVKFRLGNDKYKSKVSERTSTTAAVGSWYECINNMISSTAVNASGKY